MKRILIIDFFPYHYLGGGQKYTRELVEILNKLNYDVTILAFWDIQMKDNHLDKSKINQIFIFGDKKEYKNILVNNSKSLFNYIYAKKYLHKFLNKNKFDIIVDNCTCVSISKKYKSKIIFIQHVDEKILFNKYRYFIQKLFLIKPSFYNSRINVVFTKYNKEIFSKKISHSNTVIIPLFIENDLINIKKVKLNNKYNHITYIGRTDTRLKNIDLLTNISILLKEKIHVIGNYSKKLELTKNKIIYDGQKTNEEIINSVLPHVKSIILTSHSEGLPFIVLEAFSLGKPVIVRDTFTNAKYLVTKDRGILLNKSMKAPEIAEIINNTDWTYFKSNEIRNFAVQEFSHSKFEYSWISIFTKF